MQSSRLSANLGRAGNGLRLGRVQRSVHRPTRADGETVWGVAPANFQRDIKAKSRASSPGFNQATIKVRSSVVSTDPSRVTACMSSLWSLLSCVVETRVRATLCARARFLQRANQQTFPPVCLSIATPTCPGRRRRRRRLQRRQPHEGGQPAGRRVLGRQHRRAGLWVNGGGGGGGFIHAHDSEQMGHGVFLTTFASVCLCSTIPPPLIN
jgi:hypothetical protein